MTKTSDNRNIEEIWKPQWTLENSSMGDRFFHHRVFLESYPAFKKYITFEKAEGKKFLEVGAGSGRHGLKFALDYPTLEVVLTDLSVDGVLEKIAELKLNNAHAEVADATKLQYADNTFDIVFSDAAIQYMNQFEQAIAEMVRVLKPGGVLLLSVINWWNLPHLLDKKMMGEKYPWGTEKSFTKNEIKGYVQKHNMIIRAQDGYAPAYGVYRLQHRHIAFRFIGRVLGRFAKIVDPFLGNFLTRNFGFYVIVVATKPI